MRRALVVALALAGCSSLFHNPYIPEGYVCGAGNSCPDGQQCVPGEHVCRTPCTQTTTSGGGGPMTGSNGQCTNINQGNCSSNCMPYVCDYDHFCRPECNGSGSGSSCGGGCNSNDICDSTVDICRPPCAGGCPSGWGCVDLSTNTGGGGSSGAVCAGCRPNATSTFRPPTFAPTVFYDGAAGSQTNAIAVGDLTGSGHASVAVVDTQQQQIYAYVNDGAGNLMAPLAYGAAPSPRDAVIVDITRDGKPDLVVATVTAGAGGPIVLPGNGDGTFGTQVAGPVLPSTRLTVGDFDGDSKPDVAMCGSGTDELSVVTADGAGGLKKLATISNIPNASFVRLGALDLNGDGHLDLWADDEHSTVETFFGNGASPLGFTQSTSANFGSNVRTDDVLQDVDGDGKLDLVVALAMTSGSSGQILVLHNNGVDSFINTNNGPGVTSAGLLAAADFDGDGKGDIANLELGSGGSANIDILTSDGTTLIEAEQISIAKGTPDSIAAGDVDGDGKPDLVIGLAGGGVAVLLNTTMTASP